MLVGKLQYPVRERRGEKQVEALFARGKAPQHEANIPDEAQVEHPVGLVEHHHLHAPQGKNPLLEVVDDPPRCPDQNIDALGKLTALFFVVGSAEGQAQPVWEVLAQQFGIGVDLHRQLPGRGENQRPWAMVIRCDRLAVMQAAIKRHQVGGRLASACLRLSGDILTGEGERQGLLLYRRAARESRIGDACPHLLGQRQGSKRNLGQMMVRSGRCIRLRGKDLQITFSRVQNSGYRASELAFPDTQYVPNDCRKEALGSGILPDGADGVTSTRRARAFWANPLASGITGSRMIGGSCR